MYVLSIIYFFFFGVTVLFNSSFWIAVFVVGWKTGWCFNNSSVAVLLAPDLNEWADAILSLPFPILKIASASFLLFASAGQFSRVLMVSDASPFECDQIRRQSWRHNVPHVGHLTRYMADQRQKHLVSSIRVGWHRIARVAMIPRCEKWHW